MTDRVSHLVVTLDEPVREDELKPLVDAIRHLRGVGDVKLGVAAGAEHIARVQLRSSMQRKLYDTIDKLFK